MDAMLKKQIGDYVEYLLAESTAEAPLWNKEIAGKGKQNKWNYIDGCMIMAVLSMYKNTGKKLYFDAAKKFIDYFVKEDGSIFTYDPKEYNLDNINEARNLFFLYEETGEEKYKKALDLVRSQLDTQPRINEGNFWHKDIYENQVWLDGLFMAQPFYMTYETKFNKMEGCGDSIKQFKNVVKRMRDEKTGLYYHGYDESRKMYWADPETGKSPNFWLRAMGWFALALVDTCEATSEMLYAEKRFLSDTFRDLVDALIKYQDESGMFWQVVDQGGREGNYLETSGTALIATAILKAVRLDYIPESYAQYGEKAFNGIIDKYFSVSENGEINLGGICLVAGLGGRQHRDGSFEYYISEPVVENESKGVAPFIMAYLEVAAREDINRVPGKE